MDLVDTDILIDVQRGHPPALGWFAGQVELPAVPGFVVMELLQDARNAHETRRSLKLAAPLRIVWPTSVDCSRALSDFTAYHLSHGLGLLDSLSLPICFTLVTSTWGLTVCRSSTTARGSAVACLAKRCVTVRLLVGPFCRQGPQ
jgi:predicted nucleic acid-binding protein